MSLTNESLKCWCDNFQPQEVMMIKLFRTGKVQEMGKQVFCPCPHLSADGVSVGHAFTFVHISHVSIYPLVENNAYLQYLVFPYYCCRSPQTLALMSPHFIFSFSPTSLGIPFLFGLEPAVGIATGYGLDD
jgi:hypothetical protein